VIEQRAYRDGLDAEAMRDLLRRIAADGRVAPYCLPGDLDWWQVLDDERNALQRVQLWFDDSLLLGFAWPGADQADLVTDPDYPWLSDELISWAAQRHPAAVLWSWRRDGARIAALQRAGYAQSGAALIGLQHALQRMPAPRMLPDEWDVREVRTPEDRRRRAAAQRAAFDSGKMTAEKYERVREMPGYRPELDLMVIDDAGECAAFVTIWFDPGSAIGLLEPVGTRPAYRRRGLARALILHGLHRLRARGARRAWVNAEGPDSPGLQLYQALEFVPVDTLHAWRRQPARQPAPDGDPTIDG